MGHGGRPSCGRSGVAGGRRARKGFDIDADISIVIPTFNEALRLPPTLDRLLSGLPTVCSGTWEIIVSDDGSTDGTADVARGFAAGVPLRVIGDGVKRGKGAALRRGALTARHALVLFVDADLPVPLGTIPSMVALLADGDADLVVGSRRLSGASFDPPQPLPRRIGGKVFRSAIATMGYDVTSDPQCGVKLLRREPLAGLLADVTCEGFGFDVELIESVRRSGARVVELPVAWSHVPGSSLRPVRDAVVTLRELFRLRQQVRTGSATSVQPQSHP